MALEVYRKKRNFAHTPEPAPQKPTGKGPLTFVIQKHHARHLHYDFRLEADGVLKSWSVPKGPSTDPDNKHLAVMVEDHPLEYASFEGSIPPGQYGAGEVIIWDRGEYSPDENGVSFENRQAAEEQMKQGLEKGKLSFFLRGHKLKGSWTLVKMQKSDKNWLLIKHRDEYARPGEDILKEEKSVVSGRTIEAIKEGQISTEAGLPNKSPKGAPGARPASFPETLAPMLATLAERPFTDPGWFFEPKLDGYRVLAHLRNGKAALFSRRGNDVTRQYDVLVPDLEHQPASEAILDGEIIALDENGRVCFQCLQNFLNSTSRTLGAQAGDLPLTYRENPSLTLPLPKGEKPIPSPVQKAVMLPPPLNKAALDFPPLKKAVTQPPPLKKGDQGGFSSSVGDARVVLIYYVFDILYLDGYDLLGARLSDRKELLKNFLKTTGRIRLVDYFTGDGNIIFEAAVKQGLEGIMAKRADSVYEPGKRSPNWLKIKSTASDEFVIGGYSMVKGGREQTLSSLLLGYFDPEGRLKFAGHAGSGFDEATLKDLRRRLDALSTDQSPFFDVPRLNAPTTWVRPEMVAEVKFSQWTKDGRLRAPVFLRLREDKAPAEVIGREAMKTTKTHHPPASDSLKTVLDQLQGPGEAFSIEVEGSRISLSHMEKILWPASTGHPAYTKRDLLFYLARVSPYMLPHLKDRPLTMSRYPDGIYGEHFWQKHWGQAIPEFVERVNIHEEKGTSGEYLVCRNLATLLWLGQAANLEFHTWFSRTIAGPDTAGDKTGIDQVLDFPDFLIFDLDPYIYSGKEPSGAEPELNREGFNKTCEAALWLKKVLDGLSLKAFVKTSGKTGLHIYVPIKRNLDYKAVRQAAETAGRYLMQKHPREITLEWSTEKRKGKVFVDWGQNVRGKTLASIYSPRPAPEATVSTPLEWEELGKVYPADFTLATLPARLKETGDLWADILAAARDLEEAVKKR